MTTDKDKIKLVITNAIIKSIRDFAVKAVNKKAKFQILDLLIPKERKIRSIVGGLETSMGSTLWEPLAKELARNNRFIVHESDLECPVNMPSSLGNCLQSLIEDRKKIKSIYDATSSHDAIKKVCESFIESPIEKFGTPPKGRGVDVWLEKNGINYFFDTKTVQPNLNTLSTCLDQVLGWYAYFYSKHPAAIAEARIVFPYNPTPEKSFWDGVIGNGKPLEPDKEAWVGNEFWDFCSGYTGTFELILESFNEIKESKKLDKIFRKLLKVI